MTWAIANKGDVGRFLGSVGTWWSWLDPSHESVQRFGAREEAEDFISLLPHRVRKDSVPRELAK